MTQLPAFGSRAIIVDEQNGSKVNKTRPFLLRWPHSARWVSGSSRARTASLAWPDIVPRMQFWQFRLSAQNEYRASGRAGALAERERLTAFRVGARAEDTPVRLGDRYVVDAGLATAHIALVVEFPEFVAVAAVPLPAGIVGFILEPDRDPGILRQLSRISGGEAYLPADSSEMAPVLRRIAKDIRTRYTIGYAPPQDNGDLRHIQVRATAPGHGSLLVRTRMSYRYDETESQKRK